ncbi:carboxymuconolactone decarboxylase family protein [Kribbella sancticallisti]|uniref:Carboxymuconolactone decarboxylase family protein n=1 Tax=Kribbella sancticallisti TaxID=460087 RepID=A0ABN2DP30_9ACTN
MSYLPSLPSDAVLLTVFRTYPTPAVPLLEYHEALLRSPSLLTIAQRELIAAYVSGLNACDYCYGIHTVTAEAFGLPEGTLTALIEDVDTAPIDEPLRPLLRYVAKLTRTPAKVTSADVAAVLDAGWDESAVHDAASVCGLFNLMNRLVDGLGLTADPGYRELAAHRLADHGYAHLKSLLGGTR